MPILAQLVESNASPASPTRMTRIRGLVLMVLGPLLTAGVGAALIALLSQPDFRFDGNDRELTTALAVMAAVVVVGPVFTLGGWQLWRHGRFTRTLAIVAAVLVLAMLALMKFAKGVFG